MWTSLSNTALHCVIFHDFSPLKRRVMIGFTINTPEWDWAFLLCGIHTVDGSTPIGICCNVHFVIDKYWVEAIIDHCVENPESLVPGPLFVMESWWLTRGCKSALVPLLYVDTSWLGGSDHLEEAVSVSLRRPLCVQCPVLTFLHCAFSNVSSVDAKCQCLSGVRSVSSAQYPVWGEPLEKFGQMNLEMVRFWISAEVKSLVWRKWNDKHRQWIWGWGGWSRWWWWSVHL